MEAVFGEPVSAGRFSLLSGKVQGIFADSAEGTGPGSVFRTINQVVAAKFPKQKNREFSRENSEFPQRNRECPMSTGTLLLGRVLINPPCRPGAETSAFGVKPTSLSLYLMQINVVAKAIPHNSRLPEALFSKLTKLLSG